MTTFNKQLDFRLDGNYDITYQTDRTLDVTLSATTCNNKINIYFNELVPSGDTPFEFSGYTGATLVVKTQPTFQYKVLEFSTLDGSIFLGLNGEFKLNKTDGEMDIRFGNYEYDMYLIENNDKIPFMSGKFKLKNNVT